MPRAVRSDRNSSAFQPSRRLPGRALPAAAALLLAMTGALAVTSSPAAQADNPAENPEFESGTTGWNAPLSELTLIGARPGTYAARISDPIDGIGVLNDTPNIVENATRPAYHATASLRTTTGPLTAVLRIREVDQNGLVATSEETVRLADDRWQRVQLSHTIRGSVSWLDLNVLVPSMGPHDVLDVDRVHVNATGSPGPAPAPEPEPEPDPGPPPAPGGCSVNNNLVPNCGALWGIYNTIGSIPGATNWTTAITAMEDKVGRRFDLVKRYHDFSNNGSSGAFPDSHERTLAHGNRIPFISWVSANYSSGADYRWADVASGRFDASVIDPVARRLKAYGGKLFLDFDHEMDGRIRVDDGTPADYVRAYRHIRNRFDAIGADNVVFVWTTTGYLGNEDKIRATYPGDAYVDWIAYDPYNFGVCHDTPWKDFGKTVDTFYDWLMANGHGDKPFMLGEYGTAPDPLDAGRRAAWFRGQVAGMKAHPNIKAVMYYNSHGSCSASTSSSISRDPAAIDAFGDAGRDPYFRVAH